MKTLQHLKLEVGTLVKDKGLFGYGFGGQKDKFLCCGWKL